MIRNIEYTNKLPSKTEGSDGSTKIVRDRGSVYLYHKMAGQWYKVKLEKA